MGPVRRLTWLFLMLSLLATSCTGFQGSPTVLEPTLTPIPDRGELLPSAPGPSESAGPDGADGDESDGESLAGGEDEERLDRLVVQTDDFNLFTIKPDGSDRIDLTDADTGAHSQPTWSPDGGRVAWSRFDATTSQASIASDRFDRSSPIEVEVPVPPFYLSWDRGSAQLAYLAPAVGGIDLGVAEISDEGEARRLDRGEPYWFSWGDDGDELFIHASTLRLDLVGFDGSTRIVEEFPAPFQVPVWIGAESTLVYADRLDGVNTLVTTGERGEGRLELATYDGYLQFVVTSDGGRVALQVTEREREDGIVTASFPAEASMSAISAVAQQTPTPFVVPTPDPDDPFADPIDVLVPNQLQIMGLYGGEPFVVSGTPALAFYWAPDGETLAWLERAPRQDGALQWWFYSNDQIYSAAPFVPSTTFVRNYLPFFDQYAQSMTFWSPFSDEIVYAGISPETGESGIWAQPVEPGVAPRFIADGEFAAWSPTAAGGAISAL